MSENTVAIVVTYNRKKLLHKCVDAILSQTLPVDKLLLIDNASTDGTKEFLMDLGTLANPLIEYVRLSRNTGAAGGFHEGLKRAYDAGYGWFWLMDDDGVPDADCLKNLLDKIPENVVISPMSLREDDHKYLSIPVGVGGKVLFNRSDLLSFKDENGNIFGWSCFYHGTLISRKVLEKSGLPKPELFLWGDEEEYQMRMKNSGFSLCTQVTALFFHPAERRTFQYLFGRYGVVLFDRSWRFFCYFRNHAYIGRMHKKTHGIKFFMLYSYYTIIKRKSINDFLFFVSAFFDGWLKRFKKRVPF
ncbi:glycosyltransferase [Acidithiobacillus sp. VAN18-1]|uniref:Glycosyltransferase n=1 Tax=Igneacidithiobacillus copahuensis TaxID=2724909 RepID=A0AAE2YMS5_9PROT|nr:glycosyltransferase family 2 protein [Igneacidithiobacillus copahuensis]MBU2786954.1 glycosyltransferase [Igneacidithiobacillus copahuensis]MBU2796537.1 glycosyltransferase [Acidithiobacillus sp. VAN18-2]